MILIKEEIIADTLRLMYETGVSGTDICVVDQAAAALWNVTHGSKYITLYVSPEAYDALAESRWLSALEFSPKLPGDVHPTPGMVGMGKYSVFMHPSFTDMSKKFIEDIPVCSLDQTLRGMEKRKIFYPFKDKIKLVSDFFDDLTPAELEFVRKLLSFDKYYHRSDDASAYRAGKKKEAELLHLMDTYPRMKSMGDLLNELHIKTTTLSGFEVEKFAQDVLDNIDTSSQPSVCTN